MGSVNSGFRQIVFFFLLASSGTIIIDKETDCEILAGSLLYISHHMLQLPVLAILASTGSIPRNTDTAAPRPTSTPLPLPAFAAASRRHGLATRACP